MPLKVSFISHILMTLYATGTKETQVPIFQAYESTQLFLIFRMIQAMDSSHRDCDNLVPFKEGNLKHIRTVSSQRLQ